LALENGFSIPKMVREKSPDLIEILTLFLKMWEYLMN